jgi:hypothetical protein
MASKTRSFDEVTKKTDRDFAAGFHRLTKHLVFGKLPSSYIDQFREQLLEEYDNSCEWIEDFFSDKATSWLVEIHMGKVYAVLGAIIIREDHRLYGRPAFFVEIECSFDRTRNKGLASSVTSGRLLWCYALQFMFQKHNRPFYVWNHAVDTAQAYHKSMKMKTYSDLFGDSPKTLSHLIKYTKNMQSNETADTRKEYLEDGSYLFYASNPAANYNSPLDIFHNACELSTRWNTGGTRKNKR